MDSRLFSTGTATLNVPFLDPFLVDTPPLTLVAQQENVPTHCGLVSWVRWRGIDRKQKHH